MSKPNYSQVFAIKAKNERKIKQMCPKANEMSGIYAFTRISEEGIRFFYAGQAVNLISRLASHLSGYQHIDLSIKKWGLYSDKNPYGWKVHILEYTKDLDERERYWIKRYIDEGWQTRNSNLGGQNAGKVGLDSNKPARGYYDGKKQGRKDLAKEIRDLVEKYLVISTRKDGKLAQNALEKFKKLISEE